MTVTSTPRKDMVFPNDTVLTKVAEPYRNNTHFAGFTWAEGGWTRRYNGGACYDPGDHHPEMRGALTFNPGPGPPGAVKRP